MWNIPVGESADVEPKVVSQATKSEQLTVKNKRSTVKRKITIYLKGLTALIEQCGSKTRIHGIKVMFTRS